MEAKLLFHMPTQHKKYNPQTGIAILEKQKKEWAMSK
jgi:hypothetical protein